MTVAEDFVQSKLVLDRNSLPRSLYKYFLKRYSLWSRFDEGIWMDEESWYSVTPEQIAIHTAQRLSCRVIVDAFCGAGGNAIQFAKTCDRVIAIDIDPVKIAIAQNNARVYGVLDKITFIQGDVRNVLLSLLDYEDVDVVFMSPPWGGPEYVKTEAFDIEFMPLPGSELYSLAKKLTENIVFFLPRNVNAAQMSGLCGGLTFCELELVILNDHPNSCLIYYGDRVRQIPSSSSISLSTPKVA